MKTKETTDLTLFVRTSRDDITVWNRQKIIDALIRETNVDMATAEEISEEVERQISASSIGILTSPLIRELVNAKLIERGLDRATKMHGRLGFPPYDVDHLIFYKNNQNANVPHSPEGTNLILAEGIKRDYALLNVFSEDVGYAHLTGDIHLHHLGYIDRAYCSCQSLEYIKKYGLNVPHSLAVAAPAKHAEVLLAHMVRFAAALQGNYSGAIGWLDVNILFAPYLKGLSYKEVEQLAQMLVYEFAQQAVGRGGQTLFTDLHLQWDVPCYLSHIPAIGPAGLYTGETYDFYADEAQRFFWALFEVYKKGDASGRPFVFPRPIIHITESFFENPGYRKVLHHVCEAAAEKGNPYFMFDRENFMNLSECGRIKIRGAGNNNFRDPWSMRFSAIQNISINLPRLGYKAGGDDTLLFSLLKSQMNLVAKAHMQKKYFIEKLLSHGNDGPLSLLTADLDGAPYLKLAHAVYLMGIVGLNELVKIHKGSELHESDDAWTFGYNVILKMKENADLLSDEYGLNFILEQSPAESTPYRFARLDLKYFSPAAG
ncbi:MAG: anaerobic ribonucleoside-triphosphate reductase, partial [Syntrophales bacterium]|nr:anaerobic ribonucleoside-triphosphate reductase [Syntrophales bacterium]